ncbi:Uncharacterised protein [Klebsiella pneumoniae]|nr:Uncharacterised protein [Klebsiella pneumoniae]
MNAASKYCVRVSCNLLHQSHCATTVIDQAGRQAINAESALNEFAIIGAIGKFQVQEFLVLERRRCTLDTPLHFPAKSDILYPKVCC